jgi:hypothetical protein
MDGPDTQHPSDVAQGNAQDATAARLRRWGLMAAAFFIVLAVLGYALTRGGRLPDGALAAAPPSDVKTLQQALATAQKNDEVSRAANKKLQDDLAARDAEIATLKEDLAFYERFVGTSAQRQPLGVEELKLTQREGQVWQYAAVVARCNASGSEAAGRLSFSVEGTQAGKLTKLAWSDLRQGAGSDGVPFSLKYFQRLGGDFMLPAGFVPTRITARLVPQQGAPVEKSFDWKAVAQ